VGTISGALSKTQRARRVPASVTTLYSPSLWCDIERAIAFSHSIRAGFNSACRYANTSLERTSRRV
jgi:hypothetical protein